MRISDWSSDVCSSDLARGGSLNAGVGLSIPLRSLITGSLAGTQVYANATLTALVKGVGAFGAVTTGRSVGYSNGPLSSHIPSGGDPGQYAVQGGAAWGGGGEGQFKIGRAHV